MEKKDGTTVPEVRDSLVPITSHIDKRFKSHKCASISYPWGGMITQTFERTCHHSVAHDTNWIMNFFIYFYPKNDLTCHHFRCFSIVFPPFLGAPWHLNACFQRLVVVLQPVATEVVQSCRSLKSIRRWELQTFGILDGRWLRKHRKLGPEIQVWHTHPCYVWRVLRVIGSIITWKKGCGLE